MNPTIHSPQDRVRDAVEAVYRTFAGPAPRIIEGCPCCIDTRHVDALLATPLRVLSGQTLWRYTTGAFLTVGAERDFRYLLPRILEVAVQDAGNSPGPEIVLGKLRLLCWNAWAAEDRRVVEDLIDAWFEMALARDMAEAASGWLSISEAESVLCGAALADLPLKRWLDRLLASDAVAVMAEIADRYPKQLSAFWTDAPAGFAELAHAIGKSPT